MSNTAKIALAGLVLALLGFGLTQFLDTDKDSPAPLATNVQDKVIPEPTRATHGESQATQPQAQAMIDDDPIGDLRLEGQVVDEEDRPVAGATVILGSAPPKTTTSEEDGSFAFEALVSRRYPVYARSSDRVGGPVIVTLSADTDPVLVRMQAGGGIEIEVVDDKDMPIAGATVSVPNLRSITEQTNAKGIATIINVPPGQSLVSASASGFATATSLVSIPRSADAVGRQRLSLSPGTKLSGTVVDHEGKPVAEASVIARRVGTFLQTEDPRRDGVKSDAKGRFELPAVAAGSVQLLAVHDDHAPSTTERITVGSSEMSGIELEMKQGAAIAGKVVRKDGTPVAWATIRTISAASAGMMGGGGIDRQMIAGEDGSFRMTGLPRAELLVHGSSKDASSEGLAVDLRTKASATKLEIVLTVEGVIRGLVVDEHGEAIPEAQVHAFPDFWEGADMDQLRGRGPAFATTGGDGSFVLRGLPESKYKVQASRGLETYNPGGNTGVSAKTGDSQVRVVLASPGMIVGRIVAGDGTTPAAAMVSVGWGSSVPAARGKFHLRDVPPGVHEVAVRGPDFATNYVSKVEVKAGETTDVGEVVVHKGRNVHGRIVDASGQPVAGAEVVLAQQLLSDGKSLTPEDLGTAMDEQFGVRRTRSDAQGKYSLPGVGQGESALVADHLEKGRSQGTQVGKGSDDLQLDLQLRAVGSVRGTVRVNGQARADAQVMITSTSGAPHIIVVTSDERGAFFAERVTTGEIKVSAILSAVGAGSMTGTIITVEADREVDALLEIEEGSVSFEVSISGEGGAKIDAAQVFLFKGVAEVRTGGELNKLFLNAASDAKMGFAFGGGKATFENVVTGLHSVCVIPINGDMNDPAFAQKLQRHVGEIAVYCHQVQVAETPEKQSHNAEVPPMLPLPEE